jgi:hypothetical protein
MNNVLEINDETKSGEAFMFALSISFGYATWYIFTNPSPYLDVVHLLTNPPTYLNVTHIPTYPPTYDQSTSPPIVNKNDSPK